MNYIRLYVALIAACLLVVPALSMPNDQFGQDGRQKQCDCQDPMKDCKQMWQGQDNKDKPCGCQEHQKPMMGEDGKQMRQGQKDNDYNCGCQNAVIDWKPPCCEKDKQAVTCGDKPNMGPSGNDGPKSMMGEDGKKMWQGPEDKDKNCCSPKSMMEEDGKHMAHKHIKSMMGDKGKEGKEEVKVIIINVNA